MDLLLPKPGTYVVAVSGGVDSMALLHILREQPGLKLVVAYFDHGIREDSGADRLLVEQAAKNYGLEFVTAEGHLGNSASEAKARDARYGFLRKVSEDSGASAIITAHHQDDLLETAILNLLRGTNRKGLTPLKGQPDISRPLLKVSKPEILDYAASHGIQWREDSTNTDTAYLRNYVRLKLLSRFSGADRLKLVNILTSLESTNQEIDGLLAAQLKLQAAKEQIDRRWFNRLPHAAAREIMAAWLRANGVRDFDSKALERLVVAAKTAAPGKVFPVRKDLRLKAMDKYLALDRQER